MAKRDFLAVTDLTRDDILRLFDLAGRMKAGAYRETPLAGKSLAMIFAKSSTRTRVSFEVGTYSWAGTPCSFLPATSSWGGASRSPTPRGCCPATSAAS